MRTTAARVSATVRVGWRVAPANAHAQSGRCSAAANA
jgi:hypothetical protein